MTADVEQEREKSTLASSWYVIYARQEVSESWYYSWFIWIYDNFFTLNRAPSSIKKPHELIVSQSSLLTSSLKHKNIQFSRKKKCDKVFFCLFPESTQSQLIIKWLMMVFSRSFAYVRSIPSILYVLSIPVNKNYAARDQYLFFCWIYAAKPNTDLMLLTLFYNLFYAMWQQHCVKWQMRSIYRMTPFI